MIKSADPSQTDARARFPALDPEPPRRPWRIAAPALALIVVAALGLGYVAMSTGVQRKGRIQVSLASPFSGTVLGETSAGVLTLTDLRTGKAKSLTSEGEFGTNPPPVISPDGKYFFDQATGKILSLADPLHPVAVQNSLNLQPGGAGNLLSPWTGDDADMIVMGLPATLSGLSVTLADATVQALQTGSTVSLGPADYAAGDPRHVGAFISFPSTAEPSSDGQQPDASLKLRDEGAPVHVLATAAALSHLVGIPAKTEVSLLPVLPNPQGTLVAVGIQPVSGRGSSGIVILSRKGKVLGSATGGLSSSLSWSPSGHSLAYVSYSGARPELTQWTMGAKSTSTALPLSARVSFEISTCTWAPDGASVLCGGQGMPWVVTHSGKAQLLAEHGQVLAWLVWRLAG